MWRLCSRLRRRLSRLSEATDFTAFRRPKQRISRIHRNKRMNLPKIITLTTDFSTSDAYMGAMKGAILSICPGVTIVDITHEIPPQDIFKAAFVLRSVYRYFPQGTIHVVVVDPGVGSDRRRIAMRCGDYYFVGPDNGVFTYPVREDGVVECVELDAPDGQGRRGVTFDGRDVFGPAAARIACGASLGEIGRPAENPVLLDIPEPVIGEFSVEGRIIYIDSFGNCVTNIKAGDIAHLGDEVEVIVDEHRVGCLRNTYADVAVDEVLALVNSVELVEIAVNRGSAEESLGIVVGSTVVVSRG